MGQWVSLFEVRELSNSLSRSSTYSPSIVFGLLKHKKNYYISQYNSGKFQTLLRFGKRLKSYSKAFRIYIFRHLLICKLRFD